ncbi:MAG: hypothetical protein HC888_19055 [Candidatus Competibacteraceae bacterium]|nr:hypothetical protein [Candidatus Competibacteraceae bacterium]
MVKVMQDWRLIAPPDNWREPVAIEESMLPLLRGLAERLGLRLNEDREQRKLYVGLPLKSDAPGGDLKDWPRPTLSSTEAARYGVTEWFVAAPLREIPADARLSEHFRAGEFFPNDPSYRYLRVAPDLVKALEEIRQRLGGRPLAIHSAYRPPTTCAVGGAQHSTHMNGLAADISVADTPTLRCMRWPTR